MNIIIYTPDDDIFKELSTQGEKVEYGQKFTTEIGIEGESRTIPSAGAFESEMIISFLLNVSQGVAANMVAAWLIEIGKKVKINKLKIENKEVAVTEQEIEKVINEYQKKDE